MQALSAALSLWFHRYLNHNLDEPLVRAISTNSLLKILPAGDFGIELTKETRRIFLYGATCNNNKHTYNMTTVTLHNTTCDSVETESIPSGLKYRQKCTFIRQISNFRTNLLCHILHDLSGSDVASRLSYHKSHWNLSCIFIRIPVPKRLVVDLVNLLIRYSHVLC
jgi:hypothetical protein